MPAWLKLIKPSRNPFHASRMLLGALAFGLPMGWLVAHDQHQTAGLIGFAIFVTLFIDIGSTKRLRLESMVLGNVLLLLTGALSLALNSSWLWWTLGIICLISLIGTSLMAGFALDLKLRMAAGAYLVMYPGSSMTGAVLPIYLLGAAITIALSMIFAPRMNNPVALNIIPHWRHDLKKLRAGQFAGLTFGVLLAIACAFSFAIAHYFGLTAPNVAAICTIMVFRPEPDRTNSTIWLRILGVLLASLIAWWLIFQQSNAIILVGCAVVAGALIPVAFANGLMYVAALSTLIIYIILALMGIHGHAAQLVAEMRLIETLLGAAVAAVFALIYHTLNPTPPSS